MVLRLGGKSEIARYPGHDFFRHTVKKNAKDRGEVRQLCAQICMLFFEKAAQGNWIDIGTQEVDEYYYRNLGFDITKDGVSRLSKILDIAAQLFSGKTSPKLKSYEAIHIVLLLNALVDDYTKSWQGNFLTAYDNFKEQVALAKKDQSGEYWTEFGAWTQTASNAPRTIQRRHTFFTKKMLAELKPVLLDSTRMFGELEREIVYYGTGKKCAVCGETILWNDLEIHHVEEHQAGGKTDLDNAVPVHKDCHPKGKNAIEFKEKWLTRKNLPKSEIHTGAQDDEGIGVEELEDVNQSNANSKKSKLPPEGTRCRFTYANIEYSGIIADGRMEVEGTSGTFGSFSAASVKVTNTSRNGWMDWEVCLPGSDYWILADVWRKDSQ